MSNPVDTAVSNDLGERATDSAAGGDVAGQDAAHDVAGSDASPVCPGQTGCVCTSSSDCDGGQCIDTTEGKRCAGACTDGCPKGWSCAAGTGVDVVTYCVPTWGLLCRPCSSNDDCEAVGVSNAACVAHGAEGGFCGAACSGDADCPEDMRCKAAVDMSSAQVKQCVPKGDGPGGMGMCGCNPAAVSLGLGTTCWIDDGGLSCKGSRVCGKGGLSPCKALSGPGAQCFDAQCAGKPDGTPCDDTLACTTGNTCKAGLCTVGQTTCACLTDADCVQLGPGGKPDKCAGERYCDKSGAEPACKLNAATVVTCATSQDTACRKNTCDPATGTCDFVDTASGAPCDDGDSCSSDDACDGKGACVGATKVCCKTTADCAKFEDGDLCNGTLYCDQGSGGTCVVNPLTVVVCPTGDDSACVKSTCEPKTGTCGLKTVPGLTPCDDNNPCTVGEVCTGDACLAAPAANLCACTKDADCASKDDGDLCNGTLYCNKASGTCALNPSSVVSCATVDDSACVKNQCDAKTGTCTPTFSKDGLACEDGNPCTQSTACAGGKCTGGANTCDCTSNKDCAAKEDGDLCNGTLYCNLSFKDPKTGKTTPRCVVNPATVVTCGTALDPVCQQSQCQPKSGKCAQVPLPKGATCTDGNHCTPDEVCDGAGTCASSTNVCQCQADADCKGKVGDGPCTGAAFCNLQTKACMLNPAAALSCGKGKDTACLRNTCDPTKGACVLKPAPPNTPCQDGNHCTVSDVCKAGSCVPGPDVCGCKTDADCSSEDDGDLCNGVWACAGGTCKPAAGSAVTCKDDGNPCTQTACVPTSGVCETTKLPDQVTCTSGDACAATAACLAGVCNKTSDVVCDDGNSCTDDACDKAKGCVFSANKAACSDGSQCTVGDVCKAKACVAGPAADCDDGNVCTTDSCAPAKGCTHAVDQSKTVPCYSGAAGTEGKGVCKGGVRTCGADGKLSAACKGEITPAAQELCDDVDNDCDGATDESCKIMQRVTAPVAGRWFGRGMDADENELAVAAPGVAGGAWKPSDVAVYIYRRSAGGKLTQVDLVKRGGAAPTGYDHFSVPALDAKRGLLAVGAWADDVAKSKTGAVHVYRRKSAGATMSFVARHASLDPIAGARFGYRVAVSSKWLGVSQPGLDAGTKPPGAVWIYPMAGDGSLGTPSKLTSGATTQDGFGAGLALRDDRVAVVVPHPVIGNSDEGAVFIFEQDGGQKWQRTQVLFGPDGLDVSGPVVLDGKWLAVGGDDAAVNLYLEGSDKRYAWHTTVRPPRGVKTGWFGLGDGLGLSDGQLLVGASRADPDKSGKPSGEAHLFTLNKAGAWVHKAHLVQQPASLHVAEVGALRSGWLYLADYEDFAGANTLRGFTSMHIDDICPTGTGCRCDFSDTKVDCKSKTFVPGVCGDGVHHQGEACDDGNNQAHDGCDAGCKRECPYGYGAVEVDNAGTKQVSCWAQGPVWGYRDVGFSADLQVVGDTVVDKLTGLVWQRGLAAKKTVAEAKTYCEQLVLAGHSDWRLPSHAELQSTADSTVTPIFPKAAFPTETTNGFWLLHELDDTPTKQWRLSEKGAPWALDKTAKADVRCVRPGKLFTGAVHPRFDSRAGGLMHHDRWTGVSWLTWKLPPSGGWNGMVNACKALTVDGKSDWTMSVDTELFGVLRLFAAKPRVWSPLGWTGGGASGRYIGTGTYGVLNVSFAAAPLAAWGDKKSKPYSGWCVRKGK